ncbi:MAG: IPT/TIG domain-containing protein [Bryobacteraceae bacterium]
MRRTIILFNTLAIWAATAGFGQTYTASTFAGAFAPENLPAASVSLNDVSGVAVDAAGNVFLSLPFYAVVMRVDAASGILTRFAGNGTNGFSGDNGPAVNAQLYDPGALALDAAGNLYIVDTGNSRIRKVSSGVITTVAGNGTNGFSGDNGPATSAGLDYPYALASDGAGNLYVSDGTGVVREVSNGIITSVAGGQGYFAGIAVDNANNLYLLDGATPRVLKVTDGVATTIAGNETYGFSGDNGPATAAQLGEDPEDGGGGPGGIAVDSAGNLYIADSYNGRVREVSGGVITAVTQSVFPALVAAGGAGGLYILDTSNGAAYLGSRILKFAGGVTTTVAGNGLLSFGGDGGPAANAQFYQPEGVAIDSAGRMYIADSLNNRVRMIANGVITTVAGTGLQGFGGDGGDGGPAASAQLRTPVAVAVDPAGNLYIADINNYRVREISGGMISTVAGTEGVTPNGVAADAAGNVYVSDGSRILKVSNGIATVVMSSGDYNFGATFHPTGLALDPAGNLYVTNNGAILKLSNGAITTVTGGTGVAIDSGGNLYVADGNLGLIRKFSGGTMTAIPMSPPLAFPGYGIAVDSAGNIYGSDCLFRILVLKPAGAAASPSPVSVDFVNNAASNQFLGISPGEIVTIKGSGLGPAQLVSAKAGNDGLYPTQLGGATVQFNGVAAPLLYASSTQVAAVAPYGVTGASVQAVVSYQGQASLPLTMQVVASAPGLFTSDGSGVGQAAAINQDGTLNSASNPAPIGTVVSLFATGLGQTSPAAVDGQVSVPPLSELTLPVSVAIGFCTVDAAQLQYAGPAPGEIAGVMQINVPLLPCVPTGNAVPVQIGPGNALSSYQPATIAVAPAGKQE